MVNKTHFYARKKRQKTIKQTKLKAIKIKRNRIVNETLIALPETPNYFLNLKIR